MGQYNVGATYERFFVEIVVLFAGTEQRNRYDALLAMNYFTK